MILPLLLAYVLLAALTTVYCGVLWYASGIWSVHYLKAATTDLSLLSQICIAPLPLPIWWTMVHWQGLALFSLVICIIWGCVRNNKIGNGQGHAIPMVTHISWLLFAILCHILGILAPMLSVVT
jgi:hypothetical protein